MKVQLQLFNAALLIFIFLFASAAFSQPAEIPFHYEQYQLESGYHNGNGIPGGDAVNVFTGTVELQDIPWLSLHFSEANLGENSYLIITSLYDNHWQKLDKVSVVQWNYYSAFFNGGAVEIKLFAAPGDKKIFFAIDELTVGDWVNDHQTDSQCGPTDDRILSDQPATGRLINVGCTAWIIPNGSFVSAGHCLDGSGANVVEFQVPPSLPSGTIQHPGPEDQYSVDVSTKVFVNGGVGNDWGVFKVFPNSITGLMPKEAQGAYWPLVQDLGPDSIRITGYGVDGGVNNQVQQTHVGPNAGSSGTTMRYVTDTEGGNSGSPVIDELTGNALGVHTHGGCSTSGGNNNGTSFFLSVFWNAVEQGAGGCPVEAASNPNPTSGTTGVPLNLSQLTWSNGAGAVTNELFFGTDPGSLSLVQSGSLSTSWTIPGGTLVYGTSYYWRVDEIGDTCNTPGPVWSFTTEQDPNLVIDEVYCDNFESGTGAWTITNDGGTCIWENLFAPFPNTYTLPPTAAGGLLAADSDECGNGTTMLTTATITQSFDLSIYTEVWIEFDNDWRIYDAADEAHVEVSFDGGSTWTGVWDYVGTDVRNTHEIADATALLASQSNVKVRVRSVQPGWDWWWVLDNFCIYGSYVVPVELTSFTADVNETNVTLNWSTATETNNQGFEVQRSKSEGEFETVTFVNGNGTTTEMQYYSYTDAGLTEGVYNYRLKQVDYDGSFEYTNVILAEVVVPDVYLLEQNYPNPFNPGTKIMFMLAADSKVSLKVFDVLGQEVMVLINSNLVAGRYEVNFDASGLNSGVYLYKIEATGNDGTNFVDVKKMILTK